MQGTGMCRVEGSHWYGKVVVIGIIVSGMLFATASFIAPIEVVVAKYVAASPIIVHFLELSCAGAAFGLGITLGFAPKSYLERWESKRTARSRFAFRAQYLFVAGLVAFASFLVLYMAYFD